ncbi:MAG: DUF6134 family protein [Xanthomonadales bacterium]|jgi:hypothetical protein|nr:DUF6134 family protein [Xanthomonadales bacterium]
MPNRVKDIYALFAAIVLLVSLLLSSEARANYEGGEVSDSWQFQVFLDDKEIGFHNYHLVENGEYRTLRSEARFEYRLLFVTLFRYAHENEETWSGDCLQSIRSQTDSNGTNYRLDGSLENDVFMLDSQDGTAQLPDCVMTFAYWDPDFLEQTRLLNSQDGSFLEVNVSSPEPDEIMVRGQAVPAKRYHLEAGDLSLNLWYSEDDEWLALESEVGGGRTLRYRAI